MKKIKNIFYSLVAFSSVSFASQAMQWTDFVEVMMGQKNKYKEKISPEVEKKIKKEKLMNYFLNKTYISFEEKNKDARFFQDQKKLMVEIFLKMLNVFFREEDPLKIQWPFFNVAHLKKKKLKSQLGPMKHKEEIFLYFQKILQEIMKTITPMEYQFFLHCQNNFSLNYLYIAYPEFDESSIYFRRDVEPTIKLKIDFILPDNFVFLKNIPDDFLSKMSSTVEDFMVFTDYKKFLETHPKEYFRQRCFEEYNKDNPANPMLFMQDESLYTNFPKEKFKAIVDEKVSMLQHMIDRKFAEIINSFFLMTDLVSGDIRFFRKKVANELFFLEIYKVFLQAKKSSPMDTEQKLELFFQKNKNKEDKQFKDISYIFTHAKSDLMKNFLSYLYGDLFTESDKIIYNLNSLQIDPFDRFSFFLFHHFGFDKNNKNKKKYSSYPHDDYCKKFLNHFYFKENTQYNKFKSSFKLFCFLVEKDIDLRSLYVSPEILENYKNFQIALKSRNF